MDVVSFNLNEGSLTAFVVKSGATLMGVSPLEKTRLGILVVLVSGTFQIGGCASHIASRTIVVFPVPCVLVRCHKYRRDLEVRKVV